MGKLSKDYFANKPENFSKKTQLGMAGYDNARDTIDHKQNPVLKETIQNVSGWINSGARVYLANSGDLIGIGTKVPLFKLHLSGAAPLMMFEETDQVVDSKEWGLGPTSSEFVLQASTDGSGGGGGNLFAFTRSGPQIQQFQGKSGGTPWFAVDNNLQQVGIGTVSPNANAILDLTSTTKAFMPPRMTTTQRDAVASPTAGMVIYNSSSGALHFYNGSAWGAV